MRVKKDQNRFAGERTEALMLMAVLADKGVRREAMTELRRRRDTKRFEPLPDSYSTNISVIAC